MFRSNSKIFLSSSHTDMRKSINGLSFIVSDNMASDPLSGELFIFYNRTFDKLKIIYWDGNGFCLLYKRLEKGHFKLPKKMNGILKISPQQLKWLLDGLEFLKMTSNKKYDIFF